MTLTRPVRRESTALRSRLGLRPEAIATGAFVFVLAAWPFPIFHFGWWTPRFAALVAILPVGCWLLGADSLARRRPAIAAVGFVVWVSIGAVLSSTPALSLAGMVMRDYSVLSFSLGLAAWAVARHLPSTATPGVVGGLVLALAVNVVIGTAQVVWGIETGLLTSYPMRASGALVNPVYLGAVAAGTGALAAVRVSAGSRWMIVVVGASSYAVVLSGSRVSFASAVLVLAACVIRSPTVRSSANLVLPFAGGVATGYLIGTFGSARTSVSRLGEGGAGRFELWRHAISESFGRPFFGTGIGLFRDAVQGSFPVGFVREASALGRQSWADPHNLVVLLLVSSGLIGLGLFAAFLAFACVGCAPEYLFGFVAIALSWLLQPAAILTLPLALILLGAGSNGERRTIRFGRPMSVGGAALPAAVLVGFGVVGALYVVVADVRLGRALDGNNAASVESAADMYWRDANVEAVVASWYAARAATDADSGALALEHALRAAELEPTRPIRWIQVGRLEADAGRWVVARKYFERATTLEPTEVSAWLGLVEIAAELEDDVLAAEAARRSCVLLPSCESGDAP